MRQGHQMQQLTGGLVGRVGPAGMSKKRVVPAYHQLPEVLLKGQVVWAGH
jgi:hypothetical protein